MKLMRHLNHDGTPSGWYHWCPACESLHCFTVEGDARYPKQPRWSFDGNVGAPTFGLGPDSSGRSSMLIFTEDRHAQPWIITRRDKPKRGATRYATEEEAKAALPNDRWEARRDAVAKRRTICHYHLQQGMLNFCADCPHAFAGRSVPLPDLPEAYRGTD